MIKITHSTFSKKRGDVFENSLLTARVLGGGALKTQNASQRSSMVVSVVSDSRDPDQPHHFYQTIAYIHRKFLSAETRRLSRDVAHVDGRRSAESSARRGYTIRSSLPLWWVVK